MTLEEQEKFKDLIETLCQYQMIYHDALNEHNKENADYMCKRLWEQRNAIYNFVGADKILIDVAGAWDSVKDWAHKWEDCKCQ